MDEDKQDTNYDDLKQDHKRDVLVFLCEKFSEKFWFEHKSSKIQTILGTIYEFVHQNPSKTHIHTLNQKIKVGIRTTKNKLELKNEPITCSCVHHVCRTQKYLNLWVWI